MLDTPREIPPEQSFGDWMLTLFIAFIPIIGVVMLFVWAFSSNTKPSKANWAKAMLVWMVIGVVLYAGFIAAFGSAFFALAES